MSSHAVRSCADCPLCWQDVDPDDGIGSWCSHPGLIDWRETHVPGPIPDWCPLRGASLTILRADIEEADDD